jgi:hypothetical protein
MTWAEPLDAPGQRRQVVVFAGWRGHALPAHGMGLTTEMRVAAAVGSTIITFPPMLSAAICTRRSRPARYSASAFGLSRRGRLGVQTELNWRLAISRVSSQVNRRPTRKRAVNFVGSVMTPPGSEMIRNRGFLFAPVRSAPFQGRKRCEQRNNNGGLFAALFACERLYFHDDRCVAVRTLVRSEQVRTEWAVCSRGANN